MRIACLTPLLLLTLPCSALADEPDVSFEHDVRPIFKAACFRCHGEADELEGSLDLRLVRLMTAGGDSGPEIVPGNRDESYLYQRVRDGEMPPDDLQKLTAAQVDTIGRWIDAGARTLQPEPEQPDGFLITEVERSHWAYQPIVRPAVPGLTGTLDASASLVRNPIDAFLLARLQEQGFTFSEEAAPTVLLRRLYLDLVGLPPTPDQADRFLTADDPLAYERLVDELLASPQYGERWARHWLDVAGYADSEGYSNEDAERPHLYKYRDYVIRSFNADKPFDQFIREQLAGDEMITTPLNNLSPEDAELLTATGFLRTAPDGTGGAVDDANVARNDVVAETIKIVSSSLLGLTVGCAQCHDHRYDPIPQADYYRFRAVFEPALNWQQWRNPQQRRVSLYTDEDRARAAGIEVQAKEIDSARTQKQEEFIQATFEKEVAKLPEELQQPARDARATPESERTPEQNELLKTHPSLNVSAGSLYLYDKAAADELKKMADEAAAVRATKPVEEFVRALTEVPGQVPVTHLFYRGDHEQPKDELLPAGLSVVSLTTDVTDVPANNPDMATTGRRTAFAARITNPDYPLTARVIVNRIWLHHFGRGLVSTPGDFGALGTPPTHPELLDWLAREFIDSGWSVKHIHRLIVTSTAYRQALRTDPAQEAGDPDNLLYGGSRLKRLDSEVLRDSILAVSGHLNDALYGQPVPIMADRVGRWVLGIENLDAGRPGDVIPLNGQEYRRSIYVQVRRSRPLAVLDTFDWPRMSPNCDIRRPTTNAPQSLMLMNSDFVLVYADSFAARVASEAGDDRRAQVTRAWRLAFCRPPEESEIASALKFLDDQTALFAERSSSGENKETPTPQQRALSSLCQMLLSSNEFLYAD
jgi:mono/diheme cytochrome c family protein